MSLLREWLTRLAGTFGAGRRDADLQEELRTHAAMADEAARKTDAPDASRQAAIRRGGLTQAMESQRDQRGFAWIAALGRDLRYASRSLLRDRGSVALAVLALSLGIGATTVMFSVVHSVFVAAFPFAAPSRIVQFSIAADGKAIRSIALPADEFVEYRARVKTFSHLLGGVPSDVLYQWSGTTYYAKCFYLDPQMLPALGIRPLLGRPVTDADGAEGAPPTFLISDRLWEERFHRDPSVLGATIKLNGKPHTLIAVLPPRFLLGGGDIFLPMTTTAGLTYARIGGPSSVPLSVMVFGRLKPGITTVQAGADIAAAARQVAELFPARYRSQNLQATVRTLTDLYTTDTFKNTVRILSGAVLMLLLIACSNVANLLLARATARETELALRASLGASRIRLVRQLLAESFVLAAAGAALGSGLAYSGIQWVRSAIPVSALPSEMEIRFSTEALLAAVSVAMLTALICGLAPALHAARGGLQSRLVNSEKGASARSRRGRVRVALVAVQVTLAIVLLVGSGLMIRTLIEIHRIEPGFNPKNVLAAQIEYPRDRPMMTDQRLSLLRQAMDRARAIAGVEAVSTSMGMPHQAATSSAIEISGTAPNAQWRVGVELIGEDYFRVVGIPLVHGRVLSRMDVDAGRPVAVVNRRFALEFLGNSNPIGRQVILAAIDRNISGPGGRTPFEIIGVVSDTRIGDLRSDPAPRAYVPYTMLGSGARAILLRTTVNPLSLTQTLRREIDAINPDVALLNPGRSARGTMLLEDMLDRTALSGPKFSAGLMTAFAGVGLVLAAIGVFSVMAYTVSLQTRDIGVRMALGAEPGGVVRMLVVKGLWPIAIGAALGVGAAYALSRLMGSQIYGVTATDPWTFAAVVVILAVVGVLACLLPARRAVRVDPLIALRSE